jgi:hypothetical protein
MGKSTQRPEQTGRPAKRKVRLHRDRCPSCNVSFTDHMGIIGTCAELQQNRMIMLRLLDDLARLGVEFAHDLRLSLDVQGGSKCKATTQTKG